MRNFLRTRRGILTVAVAAGAVSLAGGGYALAAVTTTATTLYGCVTGTHTVIDASTTTAPSCPRGTTAFHVASIPGPRGPQGLQGLAGAKGATGAAGAAGAQGAAGATGAQGPAGPAGQPGTNGTNGVSAVVSTQATTGITSWPESSGWGSDSMTRVLNETVAGQVDSSNCNGAPVCYAVFGTITDTGTTVPVDGFASPNGSSTAKIVAANFTGPLTMKGTAEFQFYATSNKLTGTVPATATGSAKPSTTTNWGELAFPGDTSFYGVKLTAYDWVYSGNVSYKDAGGSQVSCTQTWNDQINPGDDGQGTSDGNITGVCA